MKLKTIAMLLVVALATLQAHAEDNLSLEMLLHKGQMAYSSGDIERAFYFFQSAADRGHPMGMYGLARMYQYGDLGKVDNEKAEKWHYEAARRDVVPAQYYYAKLLCDKGEWKKAFPWMEKAAKQDFTEAQNDLAILLEEGKGVKPDIKAAADWYLKAASNGSVPAQFKLVKMYINGNGVDQNNQEAFKWALKAAESNDPNAKYLLGYMYYSGTGTVQSFEMAEIWLEEAVMEGQPSAQKLLDAIEKQRAEAESGSAQ